MTVYPVHEITALQKPPEGWVWSPETRARRESMGKGSSVDPGTPYAPRYVERVQDRRDTGDAPVALPTLRLGADRLPTCCPFCASAFVESAPPLGQERRGMLTCVTCGRQLAWLAPAVTTRSLVTQAAAVSQERPAPPAPAITGRFTRLDGCGRLCTVQAGHDAATHERAGYDRALAEIAAARSGTTTTGLLGIDFDTRSVTVDGVAVALTETEQNVLWHLAQNIGRTCGNAEITRAVWGFETAELWSVGSHRWHALRVQLLRLRRKLGPAGRLIENRPGVGYLLASEPAVGVS